MKQMRTAFPSVLIVDAGNSLFSQSALADLNSSKSKLKADLVLDLYVKMGYQAINLGRYDWAGGADYLKEKLASGKYPFLSANASFHDSALNCPAYKIVEVLPGIKIGVLGLMENEQPQLNIEAKCVPVKDTITQLNELVPLLRKESAMILVLSDLGQEAEIELANGVKGIDIIISSSEAVMACSPNKIGDTYLTFAMAKGNSVGEYDIVFTSGKIKQITHNFLVLGETYPEDPETHTEIEKFNNTP